MPPVLGRGLLALLEGLWHMGVYLGLTLNGWSMAHYHSAWYYSQPLGIRCGGQHRGDRDKAFREVASNLLYIGR